MSAAAAVRDQPLRFTLEAISGPHQGLKLDFEKSSIVIGRDADCDVSIPNDPRVSRQHVEIRQEAGRFEVVNLSQKNFVLINGVRVTSDRIHNKALLQVGETEFRFKFEEPPKEIAVVAPFSPSPANVEKLAPRPGGVAPRPSVAPAGMNRPSAPATAALGWSSTSADNEATFMRPRPVPEPGLLSNPRVRFYGVIVLVLGLVALAATKGSRTQRAMEKPFRTTEELDVDRQETESEIKAFQERQTKMQATIYQKAYENFLRGYRDYRLGQYARARDAFQVVLNLDPGNELAQRYFNLAKIRFDELVNFNMLQGRRYLEKQNYRMCRSNFQNVITMLGNDPGNPQLTEAKDLHKRCESALLGRF